MVTKNRTRPEDPSVVIPMHHVMFFRGDLAALVAAYRDPTSPFYNDPNAPLFRDIAADLASAVKPDYNGPG